jgi:integrase/recombinase XerD
MDTGLRAGELCVLRVGDVDMKTGKIRIRPGDAGKAKGGKGRIVYMRKSARRFLWRLELTRFSGSCAIFVLNHGG